jgi:hypothetical protein
MARPAKAGDAPAVRSASPYSGRAGLAVAATGAPAFGSTSSVISPGNRNDRKSPPVESASTTAVPNSCRAPNPSGCRPRRQGRQRFTPGPARYLPSPIGNCVASGSRRSGPSSQRCLIGHPDEAPQTRRRARIRPPRWGVRMKCQPVQSAPTDTWTVVVLLPALTSSGTHAALSREKPPGKASHWPEPEGGCGQAGMCRLVAHSAA